MMQMCSSVVRFEQDESLHMKKDSSTFKESHRLIFHGKPMHLSHLITQHEVTIISWLNCLFV